MQHTAKLLKSFWGSTPTPESKKKSEAEEIENEQLRAAVHKVGPRVYRLTNHSGKKIRLCVFGCQGEKGSAQKEVAALIEKLAKSPETRPDFLLILGDNFYNNGVEGPRDPRYSDQYYEIYYGDDTPTLKHIPSLVILGNHDGNRHRWEKWESMVHASLTGTEAEIQQVMHTYLHHGEGGLTTEEKTEFYSQEELNYKKMPLWNMPYFYYSIIMPPPAENISGKKEKDDLSEEEESEKYDDDESQKNTSEYGGTQLFCINSNTLIKDYLEYTTFLTELNKQEVNYEDEDKESFFSDAQKQLEEFSQKNQAAWLIREYNKAIEANREPILAMHHPVVTRGRRAYDNYGDADIYLTPEERLRANGLLGLPINSLRYNGLIEAMLRKEGLKFKMCMAAHDHFLSYNKDEDVCQVVSGGGGGKLQKPEFFERPETLGGYIQETGVALATIRKKPNKPIQLDYHTTTGKLLQFTSKSAAPRHRYDYAKSPALNKIHEIFFACFRRYSEFLCSQEKKYEGNFFTSVAGKEIGTHPNHDTRIMYKMQAYLNKPNPDSLDMTICHLYGLFTKIYNKSETGHSLYADINKQFQEEPLFGNRSFQTIYDEIGKVLEECEEEDDDVDYKRKLT